MFSLLILVSVGSLDILLSLFVFFADMGCFIHKVHAFFKNHQHSWPMAETYTQSPDVLLNTAVSHPLSNFKNMVPNLPPGLNALYQTCRDVYPDQPNPIQVAAVIKYW